jgi:hypothetical protein
MTSKRAFLKQLSKTPLSTALVAAALLLSAGTAGATIQNLTDNGTTSTNEGANNEAFLSVYDPNQGLTFVQDLGTPWSTINGYKANSNPGLSYDLSGTNWATFTSGITDPNAVKYAVIAADMGSNISITGNQAFNTTNRNYGNGDTVTNLSVFAGGRATSYDSLDEISDGELPANSNNLINSSYLWDNTAQDTIDRGASHEPSPGIPAGGTSVGVWGGWSNPSLFSNNIDTVAFDPNGVYGHAVGFQWGLDSGTNNSFGTYAATWILENNTLTFGTPSPVPLPAAAWLFGSGVIGLMGLARRKMSQRA